MTTIDIQDLTGQASVPSDAVHGGYRFGWIRPHGLEVAPPPTIVHYTIQYEADTIHIVDQTQIVNITNPQQSVSVILEQFLVDNPDWAVN